MIKIAVKIKIVKKKDIALTVLNDLQLKKLLLLTQMFLENATETLVIERGKVIDLESVEIVGMVAEIAVIEIGEIEAVIDLDAILEIETGTEIGLIAGRKNHRPPPPPNLQSL